LTTAASQFGLASLLLWVVAMVVFFLPSAVAVRELADIDPAAGGIYRLVRRAFGPLQGFVAGWGYWVSTLFYFPSLLGSAAAIPARRCDAASSSRESASSCCTSSALRRCS